MELPMPFIVGAGRSGTTLLRLMLDTHPDMVISPETHFISSLDAKMRLGSFFSIVTSAPTWEDFHIDKSEFKNKLSDLKPFSVTAGLRCFYNLYKNKYGKSHVGDKTPLYSLSMKLIQSMLPESRFIHMVRDGRDVALSHRGLWFGPGDNIKDAAEYWVSRIQNAREQVPYLKHYLEVRFEQLILHTVDVLKNICAFLEIPFSEKMLDYHMHADKRLAELTDRYQADGSIRVKRDNLISLFKLTRKEPDASRIFVWKNQMSKEDQQAFEKIAGNLLKQLGYETVYTDG